jgi:hypothetical protein
VRFPRQWDRSKFCGGPFIIVLEFKLKNSPRPHSLSPMRMYVRAPQGLSWAHPCSTQLGISQPVTTKAKCTSHVDLASGCPPGWQVSPGP